MLFVPTVRYQLSFGRILNISFGGTGVSYYQDYSSCAPDEAKMKNQAQVVVIGGGVVGASILYHLSKLGCHDAIMLERSELTSGSTWHAAGGMHTINGDPNVAKLVGIC